MHVYLASNMHGMGMTTTAHLKYAQAMHIYNTAYTCTTSTELHEDTWWALAHSQGAPVTRTHHPGERWCSGLTQHKILERRQPGGGTWGTSDWWTLLKHLVLKSYFVGSHKHPNSSLCYPKLKFLSLKPNFFTRKFKFLKNPALAITDRKGL